MNANSQFTAAPSAPARDDDEFIDLGQILRAILRYKWGIAGLALTVTVAVGFYVYFQPLIAAGAAILVGDDVLDSVKVCSALLLFAGVYFVNLKTDS